jgi:hypothetical protein
MTERPSPFRAGLGAAFTYRRLAGVLWLGLVVAALPSWFAFGAFLAPLDQGPFREELLAGWSSWAFLSFLGLRPEATGVVLASVGCGVVLSVLLDLLLVPGAIRVLLSGLPRPVLRRTVAEGAALFRPVAWAFARYLVSLALRIGLFVALPAGLLFKAAEDAAPNGPLASLGAAWAVGGSLLVLAVSNVRFSLARIALARGDAPGARRAWAAAGPVLRGGRLRGAGLWLAWAALGAAVQAAFTALGVRMNPGTAGGLAALVVVRQAGFWLLAATRVGFQASLLAFADARRPLPPLPLAHPVASPPMEASATA